MRIFIIVAVTMGFGMACSPSNSQTESPSPVSDTIVQSFKNTDAVQANSILINHPDVVVLDVRTSDEYNAGHIDGAVNIDFKASDFKDRLSSLDRHAPYVVHCHSGRRSTLALATLKELQFTDITHLDGGMQGWRQADLPVTAPCQQC